MNIEKYPQGLTIILKKIIGFLLIIFGFLALFLPFMPGVAMIVVGVFLLGNKKLSDKVAQLFEFLKQKFSKK